MNGHVHPPPSTRQLKWVLALTGGFLLVELVGGLLSNSLALLSDAGHMLSDVTALSLALVAVTQMRRPPDSRRSFGYRRLEIVSALANGAILCGVAVVVEVQAYDRLTHPPEVKAGIMLAVAALGLCVNLVGTGPPPRPEPPEHGDPRGVSACAGRCVGEHRGDRGRPDHPLHRVDAGRRGCELRDRSPDPAQRDPSGQGECPHPSPRGCRNTSGCRRWSVPSGESAGWSGCTICTFGGSAATSIPSPCILSWLVSRTARPGRTWRGQCCTAGSDRSLHDRDRGAGRGERGGPSGSDLREDR